MKMSDGAIMKLKPQATRVEIPDDLTPCLYLSLSPSGARSWVVRFRIGGRTRKMTLGRYGIYDVAQARERANAALRMAREHKDPIVERKRAGSIEPFEVVADQFVTRYVERKNKPATVKGVKGMLATHITPRWRGRSITEITRKDIVDLIEDMATETPIAANRVAGVISKLFAWCVSQSKLQASPYVGVEKPSQETSRERTLTDAEIVKVWNASANIGGFGPIVRLLLLTGQRRDEVRRMMWSEIDLSAKTWTLPSAKAKNSQSHVVPLSAEAVAVLESIEKTDDEYVFKGRNGSFPSHHRAKEKLDKLTGIEEHWTFHDLRRTCASKMAELGTDVATIEKILNHTSGVFRGVTGTYQRHSFLREKTAALATWGKYVTSLVTDSCSNVVNLRAAVL